MTSGKAAPVAVVMFGMDDQRRPRAGTFPPAQAEEAAKRAKSVWLMCKPLDTPQLVRMAATLQAGDLGKVGAACVPVVLGPTYERVLAATGVTTPVAAAAALRHTKIPSTWAEIDVGALVLVADDEPGDGWFEAIVLEKASEHIFKLRYRDYPDWPELICNRNQLALHPPKA
jgi:hypothetical protein